MAAQNEVTVTLSRAEALVLFELTQRFSNNGQLQIEHPSEKRALWNFCCFLEKVLVEPFEPNYDAAIAKARAALTDEDAEG